MEKNLKIIIGIFLLLSALKVIYTFFVTSPTIFADEYFYSKMAQSYFYFREFSLHSELVKAYPPLYSVLISPAFIFKNMTYVYTAIKIINSVISSLIIFPVYYFAKEILTEKKALLAAILISVAPMSLAFSGYIMSENLFYVLFLTAAYFIYKASKENNLIYDAFAGIFIGLTILTRYLGLALLVPVGIIFLYDLFVTKNKTNKLVTISIALAIFGAWLFIWLRFKRNFWNIYPRRLSCNVYSAVAHNLDDIEFRYNNYFNRFYFRNSYIFRHQGKFP